MQKLQQQQFSFSMRRLFIIAAILVVALSFFARLIIRDIETPYLTGLMKLESEQMAEILGQASLDALISEDIPLLQSIVEQTGQNNSNILLIEMYSVENNLLAAWQQQGETKDIPFITWRKDVLFEGEKFGSIQLHWRTDITLAIADKHVAYLSLLVMILVAFVGLINLLLTHFYVIKPIQIIDKNLNDLTTNDTDIAAASSLQTISKNNALELLHLDHAVHTLKMLYQQGKKRQQQLSHEIELRQKAEKQLQQHRDSLQQQVTEKTHDLSVALNEANQANNKASEALSYLKDTQNQLIEKEKMAALGGLVAGIAHEVNTPIGVCLTASSALQELNATIFEKYQANLMKKSDLEKFLQQSNKNLEIILFNIERAAALINNFKLVSIDQNTDEQRCFNVNDYFNEIITSLTPVLKKRQIQVEVQCDPLLKINNYPGSFYHIISNLINNSLLHGFEQDEQGLIKISVQQKNQHLLLTYSDNGKGIEPAIIDTMFAPFVTTKRHQGGTGLGSHIIYNLVTQKLAGKIWFESIQGKGVSFFIDIPIQLCD